MLLWEQRQRTEYKILKRDNASSIMLVCLSLRWTRTLKLRYVFRWVAPCLLVNSNNIFNVQINIYLPSGIKYHKIWTFSRTKVKT
jgi:hypothetical protein